MMTAFVFLPIGLYLTGWFGEFLYYWNNQAERSRWSGGLLAVGWGGHTLVLAMQLFSEMAGSGEGGTPALLSGLSWLVVVAHYLLARRRFGTVVGFIFPPMAVALLLTAFFGAVGESRAGGEPWALPGISWELLTSHIVTVLTGILMFGLASAASILYLMQEHRLKAKSPQLEGTRLPSLGTLEKYNHKLFALGFFFLTVGLLLGVVMAGVRTHPMRLFTARQVVPAAVWMVYACFLMVHDLRGRRGRFGAYWSLVGFVVAVSSLVFELVSLEP